jgi:hypothetical protein
MVSMFWLSRFGLRNLALVIWLGRFGLAGLVWRLGFSESAFRFDDSTSTIPFPLCGLISALRSTT